MQKEFYSIENIVNRVYLASLADDAIHAIEKQGQVTLDDGNVFFNAGNPVYEGVLGGVKAGQMELLQEAVDNLPASLSSFSPYQKALVNMLKSVDLADESQVELVRFIKNLGYSLQQEDTSSISEEEYALIKPYF